LRYGLSLEELAAMNNLDTNTFLQIGQVLVIRQQEPTSTPTPEPTMTPTATTTSESVSLGTPVPSPAPSPETGPGVAASGATSSDAVASSAAVTSIVDEEPRARDWGEVLGIGAMVAGLGLAIMAGVAIIALWHNGK